MHHMERPQVRIPPGVLSQMDEVEQTVNNYILNLKEQFDLYLQQALAGVKYPVDLVSYTSLMLTCLDEMEGYVLAFAQGDDKLFQPKRDMKIYRDMLAQLDRSFPGMYQKYAQRYRTTQQLKILSSLACLPNPT